MEKFGLTLDMVQLPLSSRPFEEQDNPNILLGKDPERQGEIEQICQLIGRIGAAGIPGKISEDDNWERIDTFLAAVVPAAEAAKVRLACHPHDPYTPPGYKGVTRVLGSVAGLKRFATMHESPYHGLNFCQGTVAEMLEDPRAEIDDAIRWFGTRGKLFNVHFRNIKGRRLDFMEAFPDEGDMNMARSLRVYQEVGYQYMLMPDPTCRR